MTKNIIEQLIEYDDAYYNDESLISDYEYDKLKLEAYNLYPGHAYFMQVGATIRGEKEKLPFVMGSLTQIQIGEIQDWIEKYYLHDKEIYLSDKLDGVSCMVQYKNGKFVKAFTRGNGIEGGDITRHLNFIPNFPVTVPTTGYMTIRGELIMDYELFANKWSDEYRNPRNMVSGVLNKKESYVDALSDIDFVAYQIVDASEDIITSSQKYDLDKLAQFGIQTVNYSMLHGNKINDDYLEKYIKSIKANSKYELDGVVLTINDKNHRISLSNSQTLNPEHSIKYKIIDVNAIREAIVEKVEYNLSKSGYWKPRVKIYPVEIMGVTVTYLTGFNGKYIIDNNIGPNTKLSVTRGGSVIPDILSVIEATEASTPDGDWIWNDTQVDMMVPDHHNHPIVIFQQVLDYFKTLDVNHLKEGSLRKIITHYNLYDKSYEDILITIHSLLEAEWIKAIGANGQKIYSSLKYKEENMKIEVFLGAVKYMGFGFGVRKGKALLKGVSSIDEIWNLTSNQIRDIDGFNETSDQVANGLSKAKWLSEQIGLIFVYDKIGTQYSNLNVVFTGFRDKSLQDKLEREGAKVSTGVSKKTTHLVTAEPNSTSQKAIKARELGITVLSLDEFKNQFDL